MSCPDCISGHEHNGHTTGKEISLHGLDSYVTEPPEGTPIKGLIVITPDAFGWTLSNVRLLADTYARRCGCRVYVPNFMNGDPLPAWALPYMNRVMTEGGLWGWIVKPWLVANVVYAFIPFVIRNKGPKTYPRVKAFMDDFRCDEGANLPVGAAGFCWGGYHVTQLAWGEKAKNRKPLVDAVFTAHPSALVIPGDIEKVTMPYSVSIGDKDMALPMAGVHQIETVLASKPEVKSEVVVIKGALHGFAVRGDPDNPKEAEQADQAEDQCVKWFAEYLK